MSFDEEKWQCKDKWELCLKSKKENSKNIRKKINPLYCQWFHFILPEILTKIGLRGIFMIKWFYDKNFWLSKKWIPGLDMVFVYPFLVRLQYLLRRCEEETLKTTFYSCSFRVVVQFRDVFKSLSNLKDGAFCKNS